MNFITNAVKHWHTSLAGVAAALLVIANSYKQGMTWQQWGLAAALALFGLGASDGAKVVTKTAIAVLLFLLLSGSAMAQTPDPFESGPPVQVTGAYSNVSTSTADGFEIEVSRRFSQHFWGHLTYFEHAKPGAKVAVVGPMYQYSLAHVFKDKSTFADLSKIDLFAKAGVGASHAEPCPAGSPSTCVDLVNGQNPAFKFAFGVGGGFNYHVNDMLTVRPAEIEYFRTAIGGLTVRNYSQFISGLTVAFGKH